MKSKQVKKFFLTALTLGVSILFFFLLSFSSLDNLIKAPLLLAELAATSFALHKLSGAEFHYGVLLLKGVAGFKEMKKIASRYAQNSRQLADFGLSLGFGVLYSYYLFNKHKKKFLAHYVLVVLFFLFFFFAQSLNALQLRSLIVLATGVLTGLFGAGLFMLGEHAYNVFTVEGTPPGVGLLIPGVTVPIEVVFALIIVAIVHELAHGVLANIEGLKLNSSGAIFLGFIPLGAFVEPNEEKFKSLEIHKKRRVMIAGSTSNVLFFALFLAVFTGYAFATGDYAKTLVNGVKITSVEQGSAADGVLSQGEVITSASFTKTNSISSLQTALSVKKPGDLIILETNKGVKTIRAGANGLLGITLANNPVQGKENAYFLYSTTYTALFWTVLLNLILAIMNLLPIFITDGHKIIYEEIKQRQGETTAAHASLVLGLITMGLIAANALPWFF